MPHGARGKIVWTDGPLRFQSCSAGVSATRFSLCGSFADAARRMASSMFLSPLAARPEVLYNRAMKTVTFYKNGDRYFTGHVMAITPRRFRSLDMLLSELSRLTDLPRGVRYLLALDNGENINALDQIQDGKAYVCSSSSRLKRIQYGSGKNLPHWGSGKLELPKLDTSSLHSESKTKMSPARHGADNNNERNTTKATPRAGPVKSKIVTMIRNGHSRPRVTVKILLNKRTAQNLDQVLNDASDAIGFAGGRSVRKLFASDGHEIKAVNELFVDGSEIYIAVGNEKFRPEDASTIVEEFARATPPRQKKRSVVSRNGGMHKQRADSRNEKSDKENKRAQKKQEANLGKEVKNNVRVSKLPNIHEDIRDKTHREQKGKPSHKSASKRQQGKHVHEDKQKHKPPEKGHSGILVLLSCLRLGTQHWSRNSRIKPEIRKVRSKRSPRPARSADLRTRRKTITRYPSAKPTGARIRPTESRAHSARRRARTGRRPAKMSESANQKSTVRYATRKSRTSTTLGRKLAMETLLWCESAHTSSTGNNSRSRLSTGAKSAARRRWSGTRRQSWGDAGTTTSYGCTKTTRHRRKSISWWSWSKGETSSTRSPPRSSSPNALPGVTYTTCARRWTIYTNRELYTETWSLRTYWWVLNTPRPSPPIQSASYTTVALAGKSVAYLFHSGKTRVFDWLVDAPYTT